MANEQEQRPAAGAASPQGTTQGRDKQFLTQGREVDQAKDPSQLRRGKEALQRLSPGESPIGVKVGSEATVQSGTHPVEPPGASAVSEATRVQNKDLLERDRKEFRKRGLTDDGRAVAGKPISFSGEGVFVVESSNKDVDKQFVSGGTTVIVPEGGVVIRPLSTKEEEQYFGTAQPERAQRASDLVKGGGQGGGGNPMHAGDVRGVSSQTAERTGTGAPGVTSKAGASPAPRPSNAGPVSGPQGGGSTSRNNG